MQKQMRGHRDLLVWQKAMALVTSVYPVTETFPKSQTFALANQMQRAAYSVPCNIAEGHGRNSRREFHQCLGVARGSLLELETQIEIARNLGFISPATAANLLAQASEVARMLNGLLAWSERDERKS